MRCRIFLAGFLVVALYGVAYAGFDPFYENVQTEDGSFFAVRPFYSCTELSDGEIHDVLWPLYSWKSFKDEEMSRGLIFWFTHTFEEDSETPRERRWLLPLYFEGRSADGDPYHAVFPVGGTIREFLGRDKLSFVLFPIYGASQVNDLKTTNVLWPLYSRTRGEGVERDRFFPFYGKSIREGRFEKKFVLWPFWTSADYFHEGNAGSAWIFFPFYGKSSMEKEKTTWVIPPFFRFTKGEEENRTFCPWPFYQKIESKNHSKLYFWPLWGKNVRADGAAEKSFLFWPFIWSEQTQGLYLKKNQRLALPVFFSEKEFLREEEIPEKEWTPVSNYWKVWPLMSWRREGTKSQFRLLELWPLKKTGAIERNWAPLWTLYKQTCDEGVVRKKALWFVWQSEHEDKEDRSEWSLLKGFAGYKKDGDIRSFRLLWINFGKE